MPLDPPPHDWLCEVRNLVLGYLQSLQTMLYQDVNNYFNTTHAIATYSKALKTTFQHGFSENLPSALRRVVS